jgi:hypothetical protein
MLTEQELYNIFSWLPYRESWTVDRNQIDDNIESYYGNAINSLTKNTFFDTHYSENGGLGNYIEFICYPPGHKTYEGNAILVCISLCAPIAAYGQTSFHKNDTSIGWDGLFSADKTGEITDSCLDAIENEIKTILFINKLSILDKEFASRQLPDKIVEALLNENLNFGNQYLHGIFQTTD